MPKQGAGAPKGKAGFGSWIKTHQNEALLGGGGIVVAIALYVRSKSSSSSTTGTTSSYANPATGVDTTATDAYSGLESQILGLQQAALTNQTPAGGAPAVGPFLGSGFLPSGTAASGVASNPGTLTALDNEGQTYTWLSPAEAKSLPSGTGVFYEPLPGQFTQYKGQALGPSTPLYAKTGP
jgi:hypothetical protein